MKHYKDPKTGDLYAYEADGSQDQFIKPGLLPVTDDEAEAIRAANAPELPRSEVIRARLEEIDAKSMRALRAIVAATGSGKPAPVADVDKLAALETEAAALRAELAAMA